MKTTFLIGILALVVLTSIAMAVEQPNEAVDEAISDYLSGKSDVQIVDWVFDGSFELRALDKAVQKHKLSLFDLADKVHKDLIAAAKKQKAAASKSTIPAVELHFAIYRYIFQSPEMVRPTPQECGVTKEELRHFLLDVENLYWATAAGQQLEQSPSYCLEDAAKEKDKERFERLLRDEEVQHFVIARERLGKQAESIAWLWEQYRGYDK